MRRILLAVLPVLFICSIALATPVSSPAFPAGQDKAAETAAPAPNTLTEAEMKAGWQLLFDGATSTGWRRYNQGEFPEKGWIIEDGALRVCAGGGGGDIITAEQYGDFDLKLEVKVSDKANSGIMYLVTETEKSAWHTGPEYQIWDDIGHNTKPSGMTSSGSCYALYAPPDHKPVKPAGEWNQVEIKIRDGILEHWINGVLLVEADINGDDWKARVAKSKFSRYPNFSRNKKGHIALQDHGHDVWFRNIKIRDLTPRAGSKQIALFNGKDLSGWSYFLKEGGPMEGTWSVKDGMIICKGTPFGYIQTEKDFKNYILRLKWRFSPVTKKAGNSGVLLRKIGEDMVWPNSVEAQLQSGSAGDFWNIGEYPMKAAPDRTRGRNTKKTHFNEHPVGEWNEYEIILKGGNITLIVNGEVLNEAWEVAENAGKICLQSEGTEIHFRDIVLVPF